MSIKTFIAAAVVVAVAAAGTAHANDAARFDLRNVSGQNIDIIQVSPVSSNSWGEDLLGDRVLRSGDTVVVTPGAPGCMFDVRVTYHSHAQEWFRNINLCRTTRISFANTQSYSMN
jgi:hypothetical protein